MILKITFTFFLSLLIIKLLKPLAARLGLLDKPDTRKQHQGAVPLIGGISIYITAVIVGLIYGKGNLEFLYWAFSAGLLVIVGALDDRLNLRVRDRIVTEIIAGLLMIYGAGISIQNMGDLIGIGDLIMPMWIAVPFTLIGVLAAINAINMVDGIDGLAGSLCVLSIGSIIFIIGQSGSSIVPIVAMVAALLGFLVFNLQLFKGFRKIFLGDAGSMMLGFTLIWLLVRFSQSHTPGSQEFTPVTALFILGLPLVDMASTVVRRARKGLNPFRPDRTHAHHILMHAGFSAKQSLVVLICIGALFNITGIALNYFEMPDYIQLGIFLLMFTLYYESVQHAFRLSHFLQTIYGAREAANKMKTVPDTPVTREGLSDIGVVELHAKPVNEIDKPNKREQG